MDEIDCIQIEIIELKTKLAKLEEILKNKLNELDAKSATTHATKDATKEATKEANNKLEEANNYSYYI